MESTNSIFEDFDAILGMSVKDKGKRRLFSNAIVKNFFDLLDKNKYVFINKVVRKTDYSKSPGENEVLERESFYFYVFLKSSNNFDLSSLNKVVFIAENLIGAMRGKNKTRTNDINTLKKYERKNLITLKEDQEGNIIEILLNNCVFVMRLSDHDVEPGDSATARRYNAKKDLASVHFYNVEEVKIEWKVKPNTYGFPRSRELIRKEMEEKLKAGKFPEDLIQKALDTVDNIFR